MFLQSHAPKPSHDEKHHAQASSRTQSNQNGLSLFYFILYVHYRKLIQIIQGRLGASRVEHVARDVRPFEDKALSNNHGIAKRPIANKKLDRSRDKPLEDDGGAVGNEAVMMAGLGPSVHEVKSRQTLAYFYLDY